MTYLPRLRYDSDPQIEVASFINWYASEDKTWTKTMTDLLLINASHSFMEAHKSGKKKRRQDEFFYYPPLGRLCVAAAVEQAGFEVACIDTPAENLSVEECAERALAYDPKILGISATTPQARSAVQIAAELRRSASSRGIHSIGFGGTHARIDPHFVEKDGAFDWMLSAQGLDAAYAEITVPKIVKKILSGDEVKGVISAEQLDANLDTVAFPARRLVDNHLYRMPVYSDEFTALLSSRGCPYNCSFCSIPGLSRILRFRSAENVQAQIEQCKYSLGLNNFQLVDDIFFVNKQHSYGVIDAFKDADVNWGFRTRVRLMHMLGEDAIRRCAEAGVKEISFGVEASDEQVCFRNGKDFTDQQLRELVSWCRKYSIEQNFWIIIGLIGETRETLQKTVRFCTDVVEPTYASYLLIVPYRGTEVFNLVLNYRI